MDLETWESDIAAFESLSVKRMSDKPTVMFYGSSSIRLWNNLADYFPAYNCMQRGFGGAYMQHIAYYFERVVSPHDIDALVIYGGGNDIHGGREAQEVVQDFQLLLKKTQTSFPDLPLLYLALKDKTNANHDLAIDRSVNKSIAILTESEQHCYYIDTPSTVMNSETGRVDEIFLEDDGVHINAAGYHCWSVLINQYLEKVLA